MPPGSVVLDGRAGPLVVGREEPANVLLAVPTVSGLHAKLAKQAMAWQEACKHEGVKYCCGSSLAHISDWMC